MPVFMNRFARIAMIIMASLLLVATSCLLNQGANAVTGAKSSQSIHSPSGHSVNAKQTKRKQPKKAKKAKESQKGQEVPQGQEGQEMPLRADPTQYRSGKVPVGCFTHIGQPDRAR
ncbi:MAG: hypothetical protein H6530_07925 [Nocardioidaceae bacterium]|nr:hypothetical protein [Nocardioidaceae bacterium]